MDLCVILWYCFMDKIQIHLTSWWFLEYHRSNNIEKNILSYIVIIIFYNHTNQ